MKAHRPVSHEEHPTKVGLTASLARQKAGCRPHDCLVEVNSIAGWKRAQGGDASHGESEETIDTAIVVASARLAIAYRDGESKGRGETGAVAVSDARFQSMWASSAAAWKMTRPRTPRSGDVGG